MPAEGQHPLRRIEGGAGELVHIGGRALFKKEEHRIKIPVDLGFQGKGLNPLPVMPRPALALNPAVKFLLLIPIGAVPVPLHHPFRQQKGHTGILRGEAHVCGICPTRQPHRQNPVAAEEIGVRREHPGIVAGHLKPQGVEQPVIQRVQFRAHTALAAPNNFIIQMGQLQG